MSEPLLQLEHLAVDLPGPAGPVDVLTDVTLSAGAGEIVGIAGESGSGKSMTGRALLGLLPDGARVSGRAEFDGRDLLALPARQRRAVRGGEIAMVFQDPTASLHPMLTVGTQLTEHMRRHLGLSKKAASARAAELLEEVRLPDPDAALRAFPHQFSGGMRQRIAIAAALAAEPRVLVADEPTTALDVTVQAGILHLFDRLARERGLTVLFITHDLGVLAALARRTYVFYAGRIAETGPTADLLRDSRHPYTTALLSARPEVSEDGRTVDLVPIPGIPVNAASAPAGCPFAPRCADRVDACTSAAPPLAPVPARDRSADPRHRAACLVHAPATPQTVEVTR
ncbi:ABC transporter ATP-binding protein [Kineococcus sp. SYSU DK003]|uniref:ABC transporter ATP-binding protein n=1 Tax=Kineococcus sp. SYSU DK003 TaxID=3383124 RepID=UPI003D7D57F1